MTLTFNQSLLREPGLERPPQRLILPGRLEGPNVGKLDRDLILGEGSGGGLLIGRRIVAPWEPPVEVSPTPSSKVVEARGHAPAWLEGRFRPRNLTPAGATVLARLDPQVVRKEGPVSLVPGKDWASLQERLAYLQRKYLLLDLVRKGFAVEADGRFWPWPMAKEAEREDLQAHGRRRENRVSVPGMTDADALAWLAAFRDASWDQMRSLHPSHQDGMNTLLQDWIDHGIVVENRIPFGEGALTTLRLGAEGFRSLKRLEEWPDLRSRGFGPRKDGRAFGAYHEQAVGDAIGYFTHEVQASDGRVTGITLDAALRREYLGSAHIPDLRVEFETDLGRAHWDIEVFGLGTRYSGPMQRLAKTTSASVRGFDPMGRSAGSGTNSVRVTR